MVIYLKSNVWFPRFDISRIIFWEKRFYRKFHMLKFLIFCYTDYNSSFTVFSIFGICSYFLCKGGGCVILEVSTGSHFLEVKLDGNLCFTVIQKLQK